MGKIEKYIDVAFIGIIAIIGIPAFLLLSIFALIGYIICKIFKIDSDETINMGDADYERNKKDV